MRRATLLLATVVASVVAAPGLAGAHALNPALLQIDELTPTLFAVSWKLGVADLGRDAALAAASPAVAVLPPTCVPVGDARREVSAGVLRVAWSVRCTDGLAGLRVAVRGLGRGVPEALVRVVLLDGTQVSAVVRSERDAVTIAAPPRARLLLGSYLALGVEHILGGLDHLAFLIVLLLLVRTPRRLLAAITAFTVAHSITLALATLRVVRYPTALVETWIALSVLVVAVELRRPPRGQDEGGASLLARRPWLLAFAFGLLHGFGFAGALAGIGLPASAIPLALVSFNLGVELGQVVFVVGAMALAAAWRSVAGQARAAFVTRLVIDGVGMLAAYWTWQRLAAVLS